MTFYLGTHEPHWLRDTDVPLFISRRRLDRLKKLPVALCNWSLDSGGFTELHQYGGWQLSAKDYASKVKRYVDEIGNLDWAAPQDWMCETTAIKSTGLTVEEHQILTVQNFLELRQLLGTIVVPVLQGWEYDDYHKCVEMYDKAGVDLSSEPTVGLGSVCRRNALKEITHIITSLQPLKLHGFGVKGDGYKANFHKLVSADSMAWSFGARYQPPLDGCTHKTCANCKHFALLWREKMLNKLKEVRSEES
jgi:hypothetical protein